MMMSEPTPAKRVLVVDDESHIVHVVSLKLRNAGFEVTTAGDGEEGYEVALQARPDLVITDYQMPYLSGIELCERLRQTPETAETPALVLTARGFGIDKASWEGTTNIVGVLSKPFSPRDLLAKVRELVSAELTEQA